MRTSKTGRGPLAAGGVAALLASACCLGPLVLITLGVSGAWISNLAALEPYRPLFIGVALVAMFYMHLRYEHKLFTTLFFAGLALAVAVVFTLIALFQFFA